MMNALLTLMIIVFGISIFSWSSWSAELPAAAAKLPAKTEASTSSTPSVDIDSQKSTTITVTSTFTNPGSTQSSASPSSNSVGGTAPSEASSDFTGPAQGNACKDILPQAEQDYQALSEKYQQIKTGQLDSYDGYTGSFGEMTEVLFQLTDEKEQETKRITDSRDLLKLSVQKFNEDRSNENSKMLQDQYMDLTVRLYSSVMDGQKILDTLKSQLSKVESTRSQFENSKLELEKIDQQRLALEAKLINLKIRCQSDR